jgi:AbrB family looped-hinge helix DNA binding protein
MITKIDKFGRLLIPKKLREAMGLEAGKEVELSHDPVTKGIILQLVHEVSPHIEVNAWGWPVIQSQVKEKATFNIKEFLLEAHEERSNKILGLS